MPTSSLILIVYVSREQPRNDLASFLLTTMLQTREWVDLNHNTKAFSGCIATLCSYVQNTQCTVIQENLYTNAYMHNNNRLSSHEAEFSSSSRASQFTYTLDTFDALRLSEHAVHLAVQCVLDVTRRQKTAYSSRMK